MRFTGVTNTALLASIVNMRRKGGRNTEQKALITRFNASFVTVYFPRQSYIRQWEGGGYSTHKTYTLDSLT